MLIKVFCVVSMLSKLPPAVCWRGGGGVTGLLNKGGGSNRLPVEFPQVQTSGTINSKPAWCISTEPCIHALIWQENRAINLKPEHFPCDCMASA